MSTLAEVSPRVDFPVANSLYNLSPLSQLFCYLHLDKSSKYLTTSTLGTEQFEWFTVCQTFALFWLNCGSGGGGEGFAGKSWERDQDSWHGHGGRHVKGLRQPVSPINTEIL